MTFLDLWNLVLPDVWPERLSRNLVPLAKNWLRDVLIDLQNSCPTLRVGHVVYIEQSDTYYKCGVTAFEAPKNVWFRRISVFDLVNNCCGDNADPVEQRQMEANMKYCFTGLNIPAPVNLVPVGPFGLLQADSSLDTPTGFHWKARRWQTSMFDGFIWLWPWLQSTERVELRFDGIKKSWMESDLIPTSWFDEQGNFDREVQKLVEHYLTARKDWLASRMFQNSQFDLTMYFRDRAEFIVDTKRRNNLDQIEAHVFPMEGARGFSPLGAVPFVI